MDLRTTRGLFLDTTPSGNDLLIGGGRVGSPNFRLFRINLIGHEAVDLGEIAANDDVVWAEPRELGTVQSFGERAQEHLAVQFEGAVFPVATSYPLLR